ncbi:Uncharacterised protein [Bordetella pertussis]|nr:Uncharacterised protein [Bordetella pertussis]CFO66410.1 Uncharacterised protein [Bordetella pertussis]CFP70207.1 Uncharacterised protein [Bordetella pertussis]CFU81802.1 Uncharacterised protein [Bordetella pertussis]CPI25283.1 Uncharacterised protein [Bordetella pertussis]
MTFLRSSRIVMPASAASMFLVCRPGMMPLKSMGCSLYFRFSSLAMAAHRSMSKPV